MTRLAPALAVALLLLAAAPASAHEHKAIGKYEFTVGWGDEPAYAGFKNSVSLGLEDANHKPVTDAGDGLKVEVTSGDQKLTLPMEPNFGEEYGEPGDYRAWLIPTRPGTYTFHFTGKIRGDDVDASFTSSDTTFDNIKSTTEIEFPAKDPSTGELAQRLTRTETRAVDAATSAKDDASGARTLGIVGIALGAVALVIALVGRSRRS